MALVKKRSKATGSTKLPVGKLRRGQFMTGAGCGAVVDMAKESVIMAGTDFWQNDKHSDCEVHEANLQKFLDVEHFVSPSIKTDDGQDSFNLPSFRFPTWGFCPKCRRLAELRTFNFKKHPKCGKCDKELIPSRFVVACKRGHLDDFPYSEWVHEGTPCGRPELHLFANNNSPGLDSIRIWCKTCDTSRTMAGSFGEKALESIPCSARRPWLNDSDPKGCDITPRTLQRGATNLYFPINVSALSIPPWSKKVQIELNTRWRSYKNYLSNKDHFITTVKLDNLPAICKCSAEEIYRQAKLKQDHQLSEETQTWQKIMEDEFRAFVNEDSDEEGDFQVRSEIVPDLLSPFIERVVLADKLREVMALRGFTRIKPDFKEGDEGSFQPVSRERKNWLPGIELLGEGIFIQLKEEKVREWEEQYGGRYELLPERMEKSLVKKENLSPRYVLLHTLSHLLIRQLVLQCGYSTAALKERIYSTFPDCEVGKEMAGILIYTASTDSEGSLGGLVREGEADRLENTFRQMLEAASWCSSDPLCIQSKGQGLDSLNMASCHSCSLLPETSCESRNCFLDRVAIVGTLDDTKIGFFESLLVLEEE